MGQHTSNARITCAHVAVWLFSTCVARHCEHPVQQEHAPAMHLSCAQPVQQERALLVEIGRTCESGVDNLQLAASIFCWFAQVTFLQGCHHGLYGVTVLPGDATFRLTSGYGRLVIFGHLRGLDWRFHAGHVQVRPA
jgi:hypothetical protein